MKTNTRIALLGLVIISVVVAGAVITVGLSEKKPVGASLTLFLTETDHTSTKIVHTGETVNLTLKDYGDGGYVWTIIQIDPEILSLERQFTWGSSGLLGDFGKDTWLFSALKSGSTTLSLECKQPWSDGDICETMTVILNVE